MSVDDDRQRRSVTRYYRWLDRLPWMRQARAETGTEAQPVHRALRDPAGGPPSPAVVHRLMLQGLTLPRDPEVLDAGCGYGATVFDLLPRIGGNWVGVTLSAVQARRGMAEAMKRGLAGRVRFVNQSYDDPLPGRFDLILAIESLIHSADPPNSIAKLAGLLKPGGHIAIVDDMPEPELTPEQAREVALFKRMWRAPEARDRAGWLAALGAAGLALVREEDLTPLCLPRLPEELAEPIARTKREVAWRGLLGLGLRHQADLGGMTLERLLHQRAVRYRLLVAQKPLAVAAARAPRQGAPQAA